MYPWRPQARGGSPSGAEPWEWGPRGNIQGISPGALAALPEQHPSPLLSPYPAQFPTLVGGGKRRQMDREGMEKARGQMEGAEVV